MGHDLPGQFDGPVRFCSDSPSKLIGLQSHSKARFGGLFFRLNCVISGEVFCRSPPLWAMGVEHALKTIAHRGGLPQKSPSPTGWAPAKTTIGTVFTVACRVGPPQQPPQAPSCPTCPGPSVLGHGSDKKCWSLASGEAIQISWRPIWTYGYLGLAK